MKITDLKKIVAMSGTQQLVGNAIDGTPMLGEVCGPAHPLTAGTYNLYMTDDGVELQFLFSITTDQNPKPSFTKYPNTPWTVLDGPQ